MWLQNLINCETLTLYPLNNTPSTHFTHFLAYNLYAALEVTLQLDETAFLYHGLQIHVTFTANLWDPRSQVPKVL